MKLSKLEKTADHLLYYGTFFKNIMLVLAAITGVAGIVSLFNVSGPPVAAFVALIYAGLFVFIGFFYKVMIDAFALISEAAVTYIRKEKVHKADTDDEPDDDLLQMICD